MTKISRIASAINIGLFASATGLAFGTSQVAFAEQADDVERIQVTGSRIKQVDMETVSPVTVIDAAAIAMSGEKTVADVLNNSSINAFGSWRGKSGYGSGASASSGVNLRGLGSSATLVLLDGRRMPGTSASSGAEADTSLIPMAIVERIEILRDGASAVYGSDAIAGVVNIITKKNFEGVEIDYSTEKPDIEGGDTDRFSIAAGMNSDKGNITFTFENYKTDSVMDSEIWNFDDPTYNGYSSYSSVPNGYYDSGDGYKWYANSDMCAQTDNTIDTTDGENAGRCKYNYGQVTKLYGDVERNSFLTNFTYELTEDISLRGRGSVSLTDTNTRYAGTPVSTNKPVMSAENQYNPTGEDMTVYMRSAQIGERDTLTETNNFDFLVGLVGYTDIGNGLDWEVNAQYASSKTNSFNYNLINDSIIQDEINTGNYDIFNTQNLSYAEWEQSMTSLYEAANHTGTYQGDFESKQIDGLVSTLLFDDGDMSLAMVAGAEYEMIEFAQISDPESSAGIISGGSGGDDVDATRDRTSAYVEMQLGLPQEIEISAALRYDRYEQEGLVTGAEGEVVNSSTFDAVIPKLGITWRPVDSLLLRASYGESFRAPNMSEMFSSQSLSFPSAKDNLWCGANGDSADTTYCDSSQQHKTWFGGNANLEAEEGESLTMGAVWNVNDDWNVELSYYSIVYDNKIESIDIDDILEDEIANGGSPFVTRGADGKIEYVESGYVNVASVETSGVDFSTAYLMGTEMGDFRFKLEMTHILAYDEQSEAGAEVDELAGTQDRPDWRGNFSASWSQDNLSAAWTTVYIGSQSGETYRELGYDYIVDTPSYFKHNVQFAYTHAWNGTVTLGINNLLDEEAPSWYDYADYRDVETGLYDVVGRTYYLRINQKF